MTDERVPQTVTELLSALTDVDDRGVYFDGEFTSWADHLTQARRWGAALRARLDPAREPHVGVLLPNVPAFSLLVAAAALGGMVIAGLNTTRRGATLAADIALADCQLVICGDDTVGLLNGLALPGVEVINIDAPEPAGLFGDGAAVPEPLVATPDDLLMLIFTSGTTGDPKAVRCTHRTFAAGGVMLARRFEIGPTDVVYLSMPMFHSNAMIAGWSLALAGGASIALRRSFSARGFVADLHRYGITYANYVGKPLNYILATESHPDDGDNALRIVYGNEATARDRAAFAERFGCRVIDGFGSTEGGVAITRTPDTPPDALGPLREPNAIIDPETGARLGVGEVGEIVNVGGSGLFSGYYRNPEATADRMRGGMYHTGDLGWVDEAGYIHFAGRLGDWLRVDGENLAAGPIERILVRHPDIRQVAVFGVPVEIGDEVVAAIVSDGLTAESLTDFLAAQSDLGPKQWPQRVVLLDELPQTATFKTVKRELHRIADQPTWVRVDGRYR